MVGIETSGLGVLLTFVFVRVFPQGWFLQDRAGSQILISDIGGNGRVSAGTRIVLVDYYLRSK